VPVSGDECCGVRMGCGASAGDVLPPPTGIEISVQEVIIAGAEFTVHWQLIGGTIPSTRSKLRITRADSDRTPTSKKNGVIIAEHAIVLAEKRSSWTGLVPDPGSYHFSVIVPNERGPEEVLGTSNVVEIQATDGSAQVGIKEKLRRYTRQEGQSQEGDTPLMPLTLVGAITEDDFEVKRVIGQGSHAVVMEVETKAPPVTTYAMKLLRKRSMLDKGYVEHAMTERSVLAKMQMHPFIVNLHLAFQTEDKLFFLLDLCPGGELFVHLPDEGFSLPRATLYAAEIACGLNFIHSNGFIYRDLKPENVLIGPKGHVRLSDFGLCKLMSQEEGTTRTYTFCGTPEYIAPEILLSQNLQMSQNRTPVLLVVGFEDPSPRHSCYTYGKEVDWWALGTLVYEMLSGQPPFYDKKINIMYRKILNDSVPPHPRVTADAFSFVKKLLERNPSQRLGHGAEDFSKIKSEPFFRLNDAQIDWMKLYRYEYEPEFVPKEDTSYIDPNCESIPLDDISRWQKSTPVDGSKFSGFTFAGDLTMD